MEIEETMISQYSTFKTDIIKVELVFLISNFFITKTYLANRWMRIKIPSCSNSALVAHSRIFRRLAFHLLEFWRRMFDWNLLNWNESVDCLKWKQNLSKISVQTCSNPQYNILVRWFAGTNDSSTKCWMCQALFFFL